MPEAAEIGEIKSPLASIIKKLGTFDDKTEFYSEETPLGNSLLQEFNAVSALKDISRLTSVDGEKWAGIEKEKYKNYRDIFLINHDYPYLVMLDTKYICSLISEEKYDEASILTAQLGIDTYATPDELPGEYRQPDQDPQDALTKFRDYTHRSISDARRTIAFAFLKKGQIERAEEVRGDPLILSPIDYLYYTLAYIRYYDSIGDLVSAQKYIDALSTRWKSEEHGGFPPHMRIPIDNLLRDHVQVLFDNGKQEDALRVLDTMEDKRLRNWTRMEIISRCITKGLIPAAKKLAEDILADVSGRINPAIIGITPTPSQHQAHFDDLELLASLAATIAPHEDFKSVYQTCLFGDGDFPGALTRMKVISYHSFQPEWIEIFQALEKGKDYQQMDSLYEDIRNQLHQEEKGLLDGEYAVAIMNRDEPRAHQIISSIPDLQLKADYLKVYVFKLYEKSESLSGWQEWVRKLKDIEELIDPDAVDFTTLTLDGSDTEPVLTPLPAGGIGILEDDSYQLSDDSDESIYIQKPLKKLLPNLALLAIQKGDTPSFEELLNHPDMANDYAVEVMRQAVDYFYRKKEISLL